MLLQDTIGEHLLEVDKAAREREEGKDRQVQGKEHPPPAHLGAGELRTPWTAFGVHGGGPLFLSEIGVRPGGAGRCGQKVNCPRGAREAALGRRPLHWAIRRR